MNHLPPWRRALLAPGAVALGLLVVGPCLTGCGDGASVARTPPVIALTSHADGDTLTGVVYVTAFVTSEPDVRSISFFLDDSLTTSGLLSVCKLNQWRWNTRNTAPGEHRIRVTTEDFAGLEGSAAASVFLRPPTGVCIPTPISPAEGAILDNGCPDSLSQFAWEFDWSDCPNADRYHLWVQGPLDTEPSIDDSTVAASHYTASWSAYWVLCAQPGHRWRVRAHVNGAWSDWSDERRFDLQPLCSQRSTTALQPGGPE